MNRFRGRLMPKHRRSKLGPTRYFPRCSSRGCVKPLAKGQHVGPCEDCKAELRAALGIR